MDQPQELIEQFSALANVLRSEETLESVLRHVTKSAESTIAVCDGASVSINAVEGMSTVAASGDFAERLDGAQYATDEGPCLAAIRAGTMVKVDDLPTDERWPSFVEHAADEGLRAVLSLPLVARGEVVGSLTCTPARPRSTRPTSGSAGCSPSRQPWGWPTWRRNSRRWRSSTNSPRPSSRAT